MVLLKSKLILMLAAMVLLQAAFWTATREIRPVMTVLPPLPSERALHALSLGDPAFYFRYKALELQNAGDTFGRSTPLKDYDYAALQKWFFLLDTLDAESAVVPAMASYYYSQTQRTSDVRYVVDYIVKHAERDPGRNWWWLSHAVYLARFKLNDDRFALKISYMLANAPGNLPIWARQMPAFIHEALGEKEAADLIIRNIIQNSASISDGDLKFMEYFLRGRIADQ